MSNPQGTSTQPTDSAIDPTAQPGQTVQPIEQQPLVDSMTEMPIGDSSISDPVIINR